MIIEHILCKNADAIIDQWKNKTPTESLAYLSPYDSNKIIDIWNRCICKECKNLQSLVLKVVDCVRQQHHH